LAGLFEKIGIEIGALFGNDMEDVEGVAKTLCDQKFQKLFFVIFSEKRDQEPQ